jgi:hypothetical protein
MKEKKLITNFPYKYFCFFRQVTFTLSSTSAIHRCEDLIVLVVTNMPGFNIDGKVDGCSSTSSDSITTSTPTSDVHSTPVVVVGSWFGGQPIIIQQLDIQASIEASHAIVAVSQAGVERERIGVEKERVAAEAAKDKSKWIRSVEVKGEI